MSKWKYLDAEGRQRQTEDDVRKFFGCVVLAAFLTWTIVVAVGIAVIAVWLVH